MNHVLVSLLSFLLLVSIAVAKTDTLPSPGITRGSPFYFLDIFFEKLKGALTFGNTAKAKFNLELAEERLAEAQTLAEKGSNHVEKTVEAYAKALENALSFAEASKSITLTERVAERTALHSTVLENLIEQAPEEVTFGLEQARTASLRGNLEATESVEKLLQETKEAPGEMPGPPIIEPSSPSSIPPAAAPRSKEPTLEPTAPSTNKQTPTTPTPVPPPQKTTTESAPAITTTVSPETIVDIASQVNTLSSLSNSLNSINSSAQSFGENEDL